MSEVIFARPAADPTIISRAARALLAARRSFIDMGAGAANAIVPEFSRYRALPTALLDRGYTEAEAAKVLASNWPGIFEAVISARARGVVQVKTIQSF